MNSAPLARALSSLSRRQTLPASSALLPTLPLSKPFSTSLQHHVPSLLRPVAGRAPTAAPLLTQQQRNIGWLRRRVFALRLRGLNAKKEEERWDPWDAKIRDVELKPQELDIIKQNAQKHREKQLKQISKFQQKLADKEASIKTPILYAKLQKEKKVKFSQKLKNAWAWLKKPQNYLHRYFFHIEDPATLTLFQKCIFVHWKFTLLAVALACFSVPKIPIVQEVLTELSKHRSRKKRGVLGLDEYCTPQYQNAHLEYIRTGDFPFDVRYLQKMTLRDLYVLDNLNKALVEMTTQRKALLEQMLAQLEAFEKDPSLTSQSSNLNPFQREVILNLTEYHDIFQAEVTQCKEFLDQVAQEWAPQIVSVRESVDVQLDTFFNVYFGQEAKRESMLKSLVKNGAGVRDWRMAMEGEFDRHQQVVLSLHEACVQLCMDTTKSAFDNMWAPNVLPLRLPPFPGVVNEYEPREKEERFDLLLQSQEKAEQQLSNSKGTKPGAKQSPSQGQDLPDGGLNPPRYTSQELEQLQQMFAGPGLDLSQQLASTPSTSASKTSPIAQPKDSNSSWLSTMLNFEQQENPTDVDGYLAKVAGILLPPASPSPDAALAEDTVSPAHDVARELHMAPQVNKSFAPKHRSTSFDAPLPSLTPKAASKETMATPPGAQSLLGDFPKRPYSTPAPHPSSTSSPPFSTSLSSNVSSNASPALDEDELAELMAYKESKRVASAASDSRTIAQYQIDQQRIINEQHSKQ